MANEDIEFHVVAQTGDVNEDEEFRGVQNP